MGKIKRERKKFHISPSKEGIIESKEPCQIEPLPLTMIPSDSNLFSGIVIDFSKLNSNMHSDDVQSIKSYKSEKCDKNLTKKEKLKLRRKILLHKIDAVNQMKKQLKIREKRKNVAVIGDTNPLHDALPSLENLIKNRANFQNKGPNQPVSKKGIEKAVKRKKKLIEHVTTFRTIVNNKIFKENPFDAITNHVQQIVANEKLKNKKN